MDHFNVQIPAHVSQVSLDVRSVLAVVADFMRAQQMGPEDIAVLEDLIRRIKTKTGPQGVNGTGNKVIPLGEFMPHLAGRAS